MLPDRIPAASAISRTVVARKPFCAKSSLAIPTMSARRLDRTAVLAVDAAALLAGWLLRVAPIAPLWLLTGQPPKRLLAWPARPLVVEPTRSYARPGREATREPGSWT